MLDVVEVSPLLPQPDDEAAPKRVLFSASASHSVPPTLAPVGLLEPLTIHSRMPGALDRLKASRIMSVLTYCLLLRVLQMLL